MPLYEYYCETNGQTMEVRHGFNDVVDTWGKLCHLAQQEIGDTPEDSPIKKVISGGIPITSKSKSAVDANSCNTGPCGCC